MKNEVRPIDANALERKIREYMEDFPHAETRLAACRAVLSMLGDEGQTPTLRLDCNQIATDCNHFPDLTKMVPLTVEQLKQVQPEHPILVLVRCIDERTGEPDPQDEDFEIWDGRCFANADTYDSLENYGKTFLAYPYYPAHIDRKAWVSVEERLPGDNERVIAYRPNEADVSAYKYCVMWGWSVKTSMKHRGISHWMPLPEPPDELEKRMGV